MTPNEHHFPNFLTEEKKRLADAVRRQGEELEKAITEARKAGLSVDIHMLFADARNNLPGNLQISIFEHY